MINRDKIINKFLKLVQIDSESGKEQQLAETLAAELRGLGFQTRLDSLGNLIGRLKGKGKAPIILLSAHMDTVGPGLSVKPVIREDVIYSEGDTILGADDKAGIVAIVEGVRTAIEENINHGGIEVVFTVMEEVGLTGSKHLDTGWLSAKMGYVFDSDGPVGTIVTQGPYHNKLKIYVKGRAAHAGIAPEEGVNAIEVASRSLARLKLGRIDEQTTANIGIISGGKAINIIPDSVYLEGEVRSLKKEAMDSEIEKMDKIFNEEAKRLRASIDFQVEELYPGMAIGSDEPVVQLALRAVEAIDLEPEIQSTGGGSDATILTNKGISTINLGLNMQKPHSVDERINVGDLEKATLLVLSIIKEATKG